MPIIDSFLLMLVSIVEIAEDILNILIFLCVGDAGRHSDGGVLANSAFGQALVEGYINLPDNRPLPGILCICIILFYSRKAFICDIIIVLLPVL